MKRFSIKIDWAVTVWFPYLCILGCRYVIKGFLACVVSWLTPGSEGRGARERRWICYSGSDFPRDFPVGFVLKSTTLHPQRVKHHNSMWTPSQAVLAVDTDYLCLTMTIIIHDKVIRNQELKQVGSFRVLNRDFILQRTLLRVARHPKCRRRLCEQGHLRFYLNEELQKQFRALGLGWLQCFSSNIPLLYCKSVLDKCLSWKVSVPSAKARQDCKQFSKEKCWVTFTTCHAAGSSCNKAYNWYYCCSDRERKDILTAIATKATGFSVLIIPTL